jgi:tetratricopeptide (TPR) repeat protein
LRLIQQVRGDLDWIVMRCLEKDKARRYRSASDLAADLGRYLQNEPVLARPPSVIYAFRKFAARHRAVFATVSVAMSALLIATGVSTWQAVRATRAERLSLQDRERAEDVSQFMLDVFSAADPFVNFGREPTARILLDQAARNIQNDLGQQPDVRARLLETIGRSYRRMGQPGRAGVYLRDALRIKQQAGADKEGVGPIVTELAIALRQEGRIDESDKYFKEAQEISRRTKTQGSEAYAQLLIDLGRLESQRGHTKQALDYAAEALQLMRRLKGPDDPEVGAILADISSIMLWADDFEGAERVAREAVRVFQAVPEHHPDRVMADYFLGDILFYRGRLDEAAVLFERALAAQRRLYGSLSNTVADTLASLAQVRLAQRNIVDAEMLIAEALEAHHNSESTAYLKIGYLQTMLATIWMRSEKFKDAEAILRNTLELFTKNVPPDHQYVASAEHYLGEALLAQKEYGEAETVLTDAIERWKRTDAPAWRPARSASALGEVLHKLGRSQDAERYLVDSYRVLVAESAADQDARQIARQRITRFYADMGQPGKLDALLLEDTRENAPPTTTKSNSSRTAPDAQG